MSALAGLTTLDLGVLGMLNDFAGRFGALDRAVTHIASNDLLKGLPIMMLFWRLWFSRRQNESDLRYALLAVLAAAVAAIAVGRALALSLPFRLRPLHAPN